MCGRVGARRADLGDASGALAVSCQPSIAELTGAPAPGICPVGLLEASVPVSLGALSSARLLSRACPLGALAKASPYTFSSEDPCPSKPVCPRTFPSSLSLPGALLWDLSSGSEAPG